MLTDEELARVLGETAAEFEVPGQVALLEVAAETAAVPFLRRRAVRLSAAAAALVAGVLVVQSLGGSGASTQTELADKRAPAPQAVGGATGGGLESGGTTGGATGGPAADGALTTSSLTPLEPMTPGEAAAEVPDAQDAARIVKTGSLTLVVGDGQVSATVGRVEAVVAAARGYVSDERSTELGDQPTSTLTMRVPVASYEAVVRQVRKVGGKVVDAESSGKDVTAQYADTQAQIESLQAARQRFLTILSGARTISEILSVQQRVDSVQGQLDRLEGQRRVLANQSSLATLTVTVSEQADLAATKAPSGLSKAWDDAVHGFTSGVESLIAHSGRALLVLMVAGVALLVLRLGWRVARRRLV
jgi:hypothetical protein